MSSARGAGNILQTIKGISYRDAGNVLRTAVSGVVRDGGNVLRTLFNALTASASPADVSGTVSSSSAVTATTESATASPGGGTSPFSYAWSVVSGAGWTIGTPAAASTSFKSPAINPGDYAEATFKCTVTDASGAIAETNIVTATATNIGGYSGEGPIP